jgi:excisionase family DNA binding protein
LTACWSTCMIRGMANTHDEPVLFKLPNPQDWLDAEGAAKLLNRSRATVYDMASRGVLTAYEVGGLKIYWRPEVETIANALRALAVRT